MLLIQSRHVSTSRQLVWRLRACSLVGLLLAAIPLLGTTVLLGDERPLWVWDLYALLDQLNEGPPGAGPLQVADAGRDSLFGLLIHFVTWFIALHVHGVVAWLPARRLGPRALGAAATAAGFALAGWLAWMVPSGALTETFPFEFAASVAAREVGAFGLYLVPIGLAVLASLALARRWGPVHRGVCVVLGVLLLVAVVLRATKPPPPAEPFVPRPGPVVRSWVDVVEIAAATLLGFLGGLLGLCGPRPRQRIALTMRWLARLAVVGSYLLGAVWAHGRLPHDEVGLYTVPIRTMVLAAAAAAMLSTGLHLLLGVFDDAPDPRAIPKAFT